MRIKLGGDHSEAVMALETLLEDPRVGYKVDDTSSDKVILSMGERSARYIILIGRTDIAREAIFQIPALTHEPIVVDRTADVRGTIVVIPPNAKVSETVRGVLRAIMKVGRHGHPLMQTPAAPSVQMFAPELPVLPKPKPAPASWWRRFLRNMVNVTPWVVPVVVGVSSASAAAAPRPPEIQTYFNGLAFVTIPGPAGALNPPLAQLVYPLPVLIQEDGTAEGYVRTINFTTNVDVSVSGSVATVSTTGGSALPVADTTAIVEGSADDSKTLRFEIDGFTAGQERVLTPQDGSYTIAGTNFANTFTGIQKFAGDTPADQTTPTVNYLQIQHTSAPSTMYVRFSMYNGAAIGWYAHSSGAGGAHFLNEDGNGQVYVDYNARSKPGYSWKSSPTSGLGQSSAEGTIFIASTGSNVRLGIARSHTTLSESSATTILEIRVSDATGCIGDVTFAVWATDGTNHQIRGAKVRINTVNKSATETCTIANQSGADDASISETEDGSGIGAISSGTLTYTIDCTTTASVANAVALRVNATSSLTQTQLRAYWTGEFSPGAGATDSCALVGF